VRTTWICTRFILLSHVLNTSLEIIKPNKVEGPKIFFLFNFNKDVILAPPTFSSILAPKINSPKEKLVLIQKDIIIDHNDVQQKQIMYIKKHATIAPDRSLLLFYLFSIDR
jgi:hypothetical protein